MALPHLSPVNGDPVVLLESSEQVTEAPSFLLSPKAVTAHGKELSFQVTSTPAASTPPSCRDEIPKSVAGQITAVKVMKSIAETAVEKTTVWVKVAWKSATRQRQLPDHLVSVAIANIATLFDNVALVFITY